MQAGNPPKRTRQVGRRPSGGGGHPGVPLLLSGLGAGALIGAEAIVPGFSAIAAPLMLLAGGLVGWRIYRQAREAADRLARLAGEGRHGSLAERLAHSLSALEARSAIADQRLGQIQRVTGLPTREPLLRRMQSDGAGALAVIAFADFDRVCAFDPAMGDRLLRELAARVRRMVGSSRMLAHVDRSHFAIWFGPEIPEEQARAELSAINYALGAPIRDDGRDLVPDTRIEQGPYRGGDEAPLGLLARLISACSVNGGTSQPLGRGEASAAAVRDHYTIEQDLRSAIQAGQLDMRFQPKIDAGSGRLCGAEALLRWNHPVRGMVSPAMFIPIVEAAGLADAFGMWALNAACREASRWRAAGLADLRVAVNVSGHQLDRPDLLRRIERTLERHALPAPMLGIELTESAATEDIERAGQLFEMLRAEGIEIAIDDFGTGFSSLTALRALCFDKIKIDREFVTAVHDRRDSQAICQSIIALGRGLGIRVLAEGVEQFEEYAWLRQHGCTEFQGFYFSQPLTGDEFLAFARNEVHLAALLDLGPRAAQTLLSQRLA